MKKTYPYHLAFLAILFLNTNSLYAQNAETLQKVRQVENGLSHYHQIKGEPTWTIEERMEKYGVPGMSLAVIHDYKLAWAKSYGVKDFKTKEPVTDNTLFQAASISKPIASYAALSMVEEGIFDMDKNVNEYLKSWQVPDNEFTKEEKVTLKRLVSHTAGLTVHGFLGYSTDLEVPTLVQLLDGEKPANSAAIRVDKAPGGNMRYSGGGYCVLQQLMIEAAQKTFPEIMQERVLGPISMSKSTYSQPLPKERLANAATGYLPDGTMTKGGRHTYPEMAAAGLWTNAAELAKFVIDLQQTRKGNSEKVLSQAMAKEMTTSIEGDFLGLGIFLTANRFGHGGWNEGFSSDMTGHLEDGYGVVVMINANQPDFITEVINSVARAYGWEKSVPAPHEPLPFTEEEILHISGRYAYSFDETATIEQEGDKVYLKYLAVPKQEMIKIADNTYVRRERNAVIQFLNEPASGELSLVFLPNKEGDPLDYNNKKMGALDKIGMEWLVEGNFEQALAFYEKEKAADPDKREVQEGYLNGLGYQRLNQFNTDLAIEIFKLNVALYPDAYNTYDSLGEGYMKKGEKELAIKNYEKSIELNPENENGKEMLKKLKD